MANEESPMYLDDKGHWQIKDRPELREKIKGILDEYETERNEAWYNSEHRTTFEKYDAVQPLFIEQILALIPLADKIFSMQALLAAAEEAKREEGERIYNMPLYQAEVRGEIWARFNKSDWQALKGE